MEIRRLNLRAWLRWVGIPLLAAIIGWLIYQGYSPQWTGFTGFNHTPIPDTTTTLTGKFLWDWLQLLIFPLVIAGLGTLVSQVQKNTEIRIASDKDNETALESFLDLMYELACAHNQDEAALHSAIDGKPLQTFLEAKVHNLARRLDTHRKGLLLQFLSKTSLTSVTNRLINLENADFDGADLSTMILSEQDYTSISLHSANMTGSIFDRCDFYLADLSGAILDEATLNFADLTAAALEQARIRGAHLENARLVTASLRAANLAGSFLTNADLSSANLEKTNLRGAALSSALLKNACLAGADLRGANLYQADLTGADLTDANLSGAILEKAVLDGAKLTRTRFGGGTLHP